MKTYREIYNQLKKSVSANLFEFAWPGQGDDWLREQGIEVLETDNIQISTIAILVLFAMRINELEKRINKLERRE